MYVTTKPIVLLSVQRSGTNFLRRVMGSHPAIDPLFGEIFDPNYIKQPLNFFNFYRRAVVGDPSLCLPDKRLLAFELFIEYLDHQVAANHYILDIKYGSIRHLESYWPGDREVLTKYLIKQKWPVIHLIRTDLLAATFSHIRARETGVWMTKGPDHCDTFSTCVDPPALLRAMAQRRQAIQRYRRDFKGAKLLELVYEQVIDGPNGINETTLEQLGEFLGLADQFSRTPETKKLITQPMNQALQNYDEVITAAADRKVALTFAV